MVSRLIEMVSFILSRTFDEDEDDWAVSRERIGELLQDRGFHPSEIAVAMDVASRIRERLTSDAPFLAIHTNRVYQYMEELRLTREARGYLLRLLHEKVITPIQHQWIVDRSLLLDAPEVGVDDIKTLVYQLLNGEADQDEDTGIPPVIH